MGLREAILDGKMMEVERARAEARGEAKEARKFLRMVLRKQLPGLESLTEIDAISDTDALESIFESVLDGAHADSVRRAIVAAAQAS